MKKYYARELIFYNRKLNDFVTFKDYTEYQNFFKIVTTHGCPYIKIQHNILEWARSYIADAFYTLINNEMYIYYLIGKEKQEENIINFNKNFLIESF